MVWTRYFDLYKTLQRLMKFDRQLMPATHVEVTCTRNLHVCRSIWYKFFLVQVSCTQLSTALFQHRNYPAHDTNRATWLVGELFWCKELWWTWVKFLTQVFWYQFLVQVSWACVTRIGERLKLAVIRPVIRVYRFSFVLMDCRYTMKPRGRSSGSCSWTHSVKMLSSSSIEFISCDSRSASCYHPTSLLT